MSVGFPTAKGDVDSRAGQLSLQLRDTFTQIQTFAAWLATQTDANLLALTPPAGGVVYTQSEVNTLRSAVTDLDQLRTIFQGGAALASAKDFRTFAKLLTGSL